MARLLIIDDDKTLCMLMSQIVEPLGHTLLSASTIKQGLEKVFTNAFDLVFLDVGLPDGNGLDILPKIRSSSSLPEVIIITGTGDPDGAELAIKNGAWDYLQKPYSKKDIILHLKRALQYRTEKKARKPAVNVKRHGIVGESEQIKTSLDLLAQAAECDASVLITGETGTGKELFARSLHLNSHRAGNNFVVVDCAALPQTLVESVLFGHTKGAFTGADKSQEGLIRQAHEGTLFLDEVGELPPSIQKAFLRVLQERSYRPVGAKLELKSDFRIVAATNRDLHDMVRKGRFRKDLLFRLQAVSIHLSPLREHREDIRDLVLYYIAKYSEHDAAGIKGFAPEFLEALTTYEWPGNVRELVNTLEYALNEARYEPILYPKHLPIDVRIQVVRASVTRKDALNVDLNRRKELGVLPKLNEYRATMEKQYLQSIIQISHGNIMKACRMSGISRSRLYSLLKKHDVFSTIS